MRKEKIIEKALKSRTAKSTRRIFFTYSQESIEERGYYWADMLHNFGSCTLLKYDNRFFALTAKHVLQKNDIEFNSKNPKYQNESPFFISAKSTGWSQNNAESLLYPERYWNISDLVSDYDAIINYKDIALIQMFPHSIKYKPDKFLDLDGIVKYWPTSNFFDGQGLFVSGFPKNKNLFDYTPYKQYSHSTVINRNIIAGKCIIEGQEPIIDLSDTNLTNQEKTHDSLWGISGGLVFNVMENAEEPYWCGMVVSGGNGIIRFIPTEIFLNAVANYRDSPSAVIDPRGEKEVAEYYREVLMHESYS